MADTIGFDPVAWSIDGGRIGADLMRVFAYAATGGAEGIVSPPDCKVHQLASAGSQVAVDSGAILIRNRSANVRNQTYVANGRFETRLDVQPTGGAGRVDLVIIRIEDKNFSPWSLPAGADAATYQYVKPVIIQNVPANLTDIRTLNLGYSAAALARINIPAGTTNITNAMITDLRRLAQPRQSDETYTFQPVTAAQSLTNDVFSHWPIWEPTFVVPEWATQITASMTASGLYKPVGGGLIGDIRLELCVPGSGGPELGSVIFEEDANTTPRRAALQVAGTSYVDGRVGAIGNARGLTRCIRIGAKRNSTFSQPGSDLQATNRSSFIVNVKFKELPS